MTPRAAGRQLLDVGMAAMRAEWDRIKVEFEPDTREEMRKLVWEHVRIWMVGRRRPMLDDEA